MTVFDASAASKARIERAKMLVSAGLKDWAEIELRYGAQKIVADATPRAFDLPWVVLDPAKAARVWK